MDFVRPQQKLETYKKEDGSAVVVLKFLASHGVQERNLTIIVRFVDYSCHAFARRASSLLSCYHFLLLHIIFQICVPVPRAFDQTG
eukprot:766795-Hanusia_phi.AAC.3